MKDSNILFQRIYKGAALIPFFAFLLVSSPLQSEDAKEKITTQRGDEIHTPQNYDSTKSYPFILGLHGYGSNGGGQKWFFKFEDLAEEYQFIYATPSGLNKSWNATDACCDWRNSNDDSKYLRSLIELAVEKYNVDKSRIYITGLSNGGFMSYRMAHDHSDLIAGIVPFAGVGFNTWPSSPSNPIHILNIHGNKDKVIKWDGGLINKVQYPSVKDNFAAWAKFNHCKQIESDEPEIIDATSSVPGKNTKITKYSDSKNSVQMEFWEINNGPHVTPLNKQTLKRVVEWMLKNPKVKINPE